MLEMTCMVITRRMMNTTFSMAMRNLASIEHPASAEVEVHHIADQLATRQRLIEGRKEVTITLCVRRGG